MALLSTIGFVSFGIWYFDFYVKRKKQEIDVEVHTPILEFTPLPHYRGYLVQGPPAVTVKNPDGTFTTTMKNETRGTTAEVSLIASSQMIEVWYGPIDKTMNEFVAKFGVIRVKCLRKEAYDCHVQVRYRPITSTGVSVNTRWYRTGNLNWFSIVKKQELHNLDFESLKPKGINPYLKNTSVDIFTGEEKDLLLFYVIKDHPAVHLCTESDFSIVGYTFDNVPLNFDVELLVSARDYPAIQKNYRVSAVWDDFRIASLNPSE